MSICFAMSFGGVVIEAEAAIGVLFGVVVVDLLAVFVDDDWPLRDCFGLKK